MGKKKNHSLSSWTRENKKRHIIIKLSQEDRKKQRDSGVAGNSGRKGQESLPTKTGAPRG
jgi:hypothetical protein